MLTIFQRILAGELPAKVVYEDDHVMAIHDIAPQAPVHVVIFTKALISGTNEVPAEGDHAYLINAAKEAARLTGVDKTGYRLVINEGVDAHQTIPHLHMHLLGGRQLGWPPG